MTQNEWLLQPLFTGSFVVLGIILLFQLIVKTVIRSFNLREMKLNYSVGWLNLVSTVYFGLLGIYFEYESAHLNRDVEFVTFRLLLLFYIVVFLSHRASFLISIVNALARVIFWGWTPGTVAYIIVGIFLYCLALSIAIYVRKRQFPAILTISIYDVLVGLFWLTFHYIRWVNFGAISTETMLYNWLSFIIMNALLYYGISSLNDENDYLTTVTRQAATDPLTKLRNYAVFEQDLQNYFGKYEQQHVPLTMIALDVDHFKRINDQYGHLAGNAVLVTIAQLLSASIKGIPGACVYRIGGEEFNVLLPDTPKADARRLAYQMRQDIQEASIVVYQETIHVTASFGVAAVNEQDHSTRDFYERADQMLYQSKAQGRNQITMEME